MAAPEGSFIRQLQEQRSRIQKEAAERALRESHEGAMALPKITSPEQASSIAEMIKVAMANRSTAFQDDADDDDADDNNENEEDWMS